MSGTTWPRSLIFGMYHQLVNLYQLCSNYGHTVATCLNMTEHNEFMLCSSALKSSNSCSNMSENVTLITPITL